MLADTTNRAGAFIDESWFVLWPYPAQTWARRKRPVRIAKAKSWPRKERPPSCALYASMDVQRREVSGQWHGTWNQEETWRFLEGLIASYRQRGVRYLVVFWDHAPWHVAESVRRRIAEHNRQAKREGGTRVLLFYLPIKSPWLMPLEAVFGQTKRAVGNRHRDTIGELQAAVERRLQRRNGRVRQHKQHPTTSKNV